MKQWDKAENPESNWLKALKVSWIPMLMKNGRNGNEIFFINSINNRIWEFFQ